MTKPFEKFRDELRELAKRFMAERGEGEFVPGRTYIPTSGKVVDEADLINLLNCSLDLHLTSGEFTDTFEKKLSAHFEKRWARMVNSGSSANLLAFATLCSPLLGERRIKPDSEVITVAAAFPTTVSPILQHGCIPVFVDVDSQTANIDTSLIEAAISKSTRAIMVAHTLGNPFDLGRVREICQRHGLSLVEDCCDALGAKYDGRPVGTWGDLATLSFYPAHHITTGEGGALLGADPQLLRVAESLRDWGRDCWCKPGISNTCGKRFNANFPTLPDGYDHKYIYSQLGYNLKGVDFQGALGCSQLDKVEKFIAARRENYRYLKQLFLERGLDEFYLLADATPNSDPSWFGFLLTIRDEVTLSRKAVVTGLESKKVGTRLLFSGNLTKQPALQGARFRVSGELNHTDNLMRNSFWVGIWPGLGRPHLEYMADTLQTVTKSTLDSPKHLKSAA